jgi:hypothetical protein
VPIIVFGVSRKYRLLWCSRVIAFACIANGGLGRCTTRDMSDDRSIASKVPIFTITFGLVSLFITMPNGGFKDSWRCYYTQTRCDVLCLTIKELGVVCLMEKDASNMCSGECCKWGLCDAIWCDKHIVYWIKQLTCITLTCRLCVGFRWSKTEWPSSGIR